MGSYRLTWHPVGTGHLAIGHKPGAKLREALAQEGCTLVVSLLSHAESQAPETEQRVRLPLEGARPPAPVRDLEVRTTFQRLDRELAGGGRVYVHCSAGLHRTGMIAYAFLRHRGLTGQEAVEIISVLRPLTAAELTTERIAWGDRFAASS